MLCGMCTMNRDMELALMFTENIFCWTVDLVNGKLVPIESGQQTIVDKNNSSSMA